MRRIRPVWMVVLGVLLIASPAFAITLGPGESHQEWNFDDNDNPAIPEVDLNPYGSATATIVGSAAGPPPEWVATLLDRDGVWKAEGLADLTLDIPNQMVRNPYKEIYLEIGFIGELEAFSVFPTPFGGKVELEEQVVEVVDPTNGWKRLTAWYRIEPNPDSESVCYSFSADVAAVDYVIVNTVCVPEPLTIALFGLGGLVMRRCKRRGAQRV